MRFDRIWAIASAEARLTRRLARFWIFLILSAVVGAAFLSLYLFYHYWSSTSATLALLNPRFLLGVVGGFFLLGYSLAVMFLAYEVRARDERERVAEPLDIRPVSNLELMFGRLIGILIPSYIGIAVIVLLFSGISALIDVGFEPVSMLLYLTMATIPALVFFIGLTFAVSVAVRSRAISAVVLLVVLGALFMVIFGIIPTTFRNYPLFDVVSLFSMGTPSDILRWSVDGAGVLHRLGVLLLGIGLVMLAAALHPRRDDGSRGQRLGLSAGLVAIGALAMTAPVLRTSSDLAKQAQWRNAHAAHAAERAPDVRSIDATVQIDPPSGLTLEATITFAAPADHELSEALFSLNPGYSIDNLTVGTTGITPDFDNGLLTVALSPPLAAGQERTLTLKAHGQPERDFAYLDSVRNPFTEPSTNGPFFLLGYRPLLYQRGFVALMPGGFWLPAGGAAVAAPGTGERPGDPFRLTLKATIPDGWKVAGPGKRLGDGRTVSWAPTAPVESVALVASRFESRELDVDGTHFELLLHTTHAKQFEVLSIAKSELEKKLKEKLAEMKKLGLSYPYDGLTLVEVPPTLRGYRGGWRLESALGPSGMVLLRETGLPTARFDVAVNRAQRQKDKEGGPGQAVVDLLRGFFNNDFSGGNIFSLVSRQAVAGQMAPVGRDAVALDVLLQRTSGRLLFGTSGFFSAHLYDKNVGQTINSSFGALIGGGAEAGTFGDAVLKAASSRPIVWDALTTTALSRLDPTADPRCAFDALVVKGEGMSRSLVDDLGATKTAAMLANLLSAKRGEQIVRSDLVAAATAAQADVGGLLDTWIDGTGLAGFVAGPARVARLKDGDGGAARYQVLFSLRNDEAVPGIAAIGCVSRTKTAPTVPGQDAQEESTTSTFDGGGVVRLAAKTEVEVGCVTAAPPIEVRITPYLSLNRERFTLPVPSVDETRVSEAEPLSGTRPMEYSAGDDGTIVVDDLDSGFSAPPEPASKLLRFGQKLDPAQMDNGLTSVVAFWQIPNAWTRMTLSSAYGRYRHTAAVTPVGDGTRPARFTAKLPKAGRWKAELYFPELVRRELLQRNGFGKWSVAVSQGAVSRDVSFSANDAERGWNSLGEFDLQPGDVLVTLSDKAEGRWVIADAVRFTPVGTGS